MELSPKFVGSIIGVANTTANAAGLFGPITAGYLISGEGNWSTPFYLAAFLAVICGAIYFFLVKADRLDIEVDSSGEEEPQPA